MRTWQCSVCKYIHKGESPPDKCPVCGVDGSKFVEITEADDQIETPKSKPPAKEDAAIPLDSEKTPPAPQPETSMNKINTLLVKHHAHPITVHTPNGILPAAAILWILAWLFDIDLLAKAALINMIFVIIAFPIVIYTGIAEWKKKYNGALTLIFKLKILAATLTTVSCLISLIWCLVNPDILLSSKAWAFILVNIIMLAAAGVAGHIGGKLVFKD